MANQTTILEVIVPDPAGINKALRAAEGIENLANALGKIYALSVTALTMPYTLPYSATEGGDKTGLHFMVLRLTGTKGSAYDIIVPAKDHMFVVDNQTNQSATVKVTGMTGVTVAPLEKVLVYANTTDVYSVLAASPEVVSMLVSDPNGSPIGTGDGKAYYRVPSLLDGMNLVSVAAGLSTGGTGGGFLCQLRRNRGGVDADMLSTRISIDSGEDDSSTAATPAVINTSNDDVETGDRIYIDIDGAPTGGYGLTIEMQFRKP